VTGATFARQCAYLRSLRPATSTLHVTNVDEGDRSVQFTSVVRARPPSSRRSCDYGFVVAAGVVRRVSSTPKTAEPVETTPNGRRTSSETRDCRHRHREMTPSSSSTTPVTATEPEVGGGHGSRGRTTVRQLKRRNNNRTTVPPPTATVSGDKLGLCSWRHSLCAGFKSSVRDADDHWLEYRPDTTSPRLPSTSSSVTVSVEPRTPTKPSRSQSLPRSFRSSVIAPLRRLLSSRSLSSTPDGDAADGVVQRPASRRAASVQSRDPPSTSSQQTSRVKLDRRSRSLDRGGSTRQKQRQSSLSHRTTTNSLGNEPCSGGV